MNLTALAVILLGLGVMCGFVVLVIHGREIARLRELRHRLEAGLPVTRSEIGDPE